MLYLSFDPNKIHNSKYFLIIINILNIVNRGQPRDTSVLSTNATEMVLQTGVALFLAALSAISSSTLVGYFSSLLPTQATLITKLDSLLVTSIACCTYLHVRQQQLFKPISQMYYIAIMLYSISDTVGVKVHVFGLYCSKLL